MGVLFYPLHHLEAMGQNQMHKRQYRLQCEDTRFDHVDIGIALSLNHKNNTNLTKLLRLLKKRFFSSLHIVVSACSRYCIGLATVSRREHWFVCRRGRVVKAFASHCSPIYERSPGSNLTTAIGPATAYTRLTQPATLSGTSNRVPASAGVMARTSPVSCGR